MTASNSPSIKWRTLLGLVFIYIAMWFDGEWAWGILFLLWVIPDLFSGVTYFMEPIVKSENPILYWVVIVSWLWMCIYSIAAFFFPELQIY